MKPEEQGEAQPPAPRVGPRIAYLTSVYPAPSHTFIRREVVALRERGLDVRTFSVRRPREEDRLPKIGREEERRTWYVLPASAAALLRANVRALLRRPAAYLATLRLASSHRVPGARALLWASFHFMEAIVLAEELERRGIEHLHNHFANSSATVGLLACRYLGIDFSFTLHGISDTDYPAGPLLPEKIEHARFVACVSHFGRAQAMRLTSPEHWSKLHIVRCGVEMSELPPRRPRAGPVRVVTVGRLSPEKGQIGLVEAFAGATEGTDAELWIVGGGPLRPPLERRIAELGLEGRCRLFGQLPNDEVLPLVAQSDLFVLPSLMEGLPVVLMEAMGSGIPVIAPWIAGIPELVEHGRSGLLFRAGDWQHLAEQLRALAGDAALRERFGRAGAERVRAEFDVRRAVEPLLERFGVEPRPRSSHVTAPSASPTSPVGAK